MPNCERNKGLHPLALVRLTPPASHCVLQNSTPGLGTFRQLLTWFCPRGYGSRHGHHRGLRLARALLDAAGLHSRRLHCGRSPGGTGDTVRLARRHTTQQQQQQQHHSISLSLADSSKVLDLALLFHGNDIAPVRCPHSDVCSGIAVCLLFVRCASL
jgi:hypothetical protein